MTYVDETRSLTTGSPLEEAPHIRHPPSPASTESDQHKSSSSDVSGSDPRVGPPRSDTQSLHHDAAEPKEDALLGSHNHYFPDSPASPYGLQPMQIDGGQSELAVGGNVLGPSLVSNLPLRDRTEAMLFRHYIEKLGPCVSGFSERVRGV